MRIEIAGRAEFLLPLNIDHIRILRRCSEMHYDTVCKEASLYGGFLTGWDNMVRYSIGSPPACTADFRRLDLCCKILEQAHWLHDEADRALGCGMRVTFGNALRASNTLARKWSGGYEDAL